MKEQVSQIIGKILVTGGIAFAGALLAVMIQMEGVKVRLSAFESHLQKKHAGSDYRELQDEKIRMLRDSLYHHEQFNHTQTKR